VRAPFFTSDDLITNLLPIIHYRKSILEHGEFPLYTTLWYGGRFQWQNPLWNFLYLPSTLLYLALPLALATKVVFVGHFIIAAWAGYLVAKKYFKDEIMRISCAFLFLTPIAVAMSIGHLEKVLAWPWVLLGLRVALGWSEREFIDGLLVGFCLGQIAFAGANYYVLYAIILFGAIGISRCVNRSKSNLLRSMISSRYFQGLLCTALPCAALKLPTVWYLAGQSRAPVGYTIWQLDRIFQTLFINLLPNHPAHYEGAAIIGIPIFLIIVWGVYYQFQERQSGLLTTPLVKSLWIASVLFILFTTGLAYVGHSLFNTFRVAARSMAFLGVTLVVLALLSAQYLASKDRRWQFIVQTCFVCACLQTLGIWSEFRPRGTPYWLDDSGATTIANFLHSQNARSVWFNNNSFEARLIGVALNVQDISLPNCYYGSMGQNVRIDGAFCGYSFEYLIDVSTADHPRDKIELASFVLPYQPVGSIPANYLQKQKTFRVGLMTFDVFKVACDDG